MKRKLLENVKRVEDRIASACARAGRPRDSVTLVAVTKAVHPDVLPLLLEIGILDLGENRVQGLTRRAAWLHEQVQAGAAPAGVRWHMIGHLQRNKVKAVVPCVSLIHSVDSLRLAEELSAQAVKAGRGLPVLIEVHASEEPTKSGIAVPAVTHFTQEVTGLPNLTVAGLMAMAPLTDDTDRIRRVFGRVRELFDEVLGERICGPEFRCLSMGMSHDFELAIEAGATHVRIGSALFEGLPRAEEPAEED